MKKSSSAAGFTLVELIVAMAITVTVLGLTMRGFIDARNSTDLAGNIVETNQNLRAGMSYLMRDLVQTGNSIPTGGIPIPRGTGSVPVLRPGPVANMSFPAWQVLHALTPGQNLGPVVDGQTTDMITVLFADRSIPIEDYPLLTVTNGGARATVDPRTPINVGANAVVAGDLVLFSNAIGNAIQTVTSTGVQLMRFDPGDAFRFNQQGTQFGGISGIRNPDGTFPPTTATRLTMMTFYIDSVTNPQVPRLVRRRNFDTGRAVALVIDNVQITYDLVDGSNTINPALVNIPEPTGPNTPAQIRKINLYLAARSEYTESGTRRTFRTNLATQLSLRSMAFIDRYR